MQLFKLLFLIGVAYLGYIYYQRFEATRNVVAGSEKSRQEQPAYVQQPPGQSVNKGGMGSVGGLGEVGAPSSQTSEFRGPTFLNKPKDDKASPLLTAAASGEASEVDHILAQSVDVNIRDQYRRTPLMHAAWRGHQEICAKLLAAGADIAFRDRAGFTALDYAAGRGQTDTVVFLIDLSGYRDKKNRTAFSKLMASVLTNHIASLPRGDNTLSYINRLTPEDQSAIHTAASNGYVPMAERLVTLGADVNLSNRGKRTPLHWAAWNNRSQMVDYLIALGVAVNKADAAGDTPLLLAVQNNSVDAVQRLIAGGANVEHRNDKKQNALMIAIAQNHRDIQALIKAARQ